MARHEHDAYEEDVVLPRFQRVIIDEAHAIEQSATSCFSARLSRAAIERLVARLQRQSGGRQQGTAAASGRPLRTAHRRCRPTDRGI